MKLMIGAAAAALLLATPAMAQTATPAIPASCANFDAAPTLVDGANATRAQMNTTSQSVETWRAAIETKRAACQTDIAALRAQLEAAVAAYNASAQSASQTLSAWNTEVTEFNGRGETADTRERRSALGVSRRDD
ncbi:MAG TPA: hypothetical protein VEA80_16865 [Vitreimonas sp.]|uniref:hypothetical protein n=1 Tax=Vitreimonas sp. TaxID=3069702 RepID=UPI002D4A4D45|nr:hypothetical protein [Vitreimonas sp.]HYD89152.1 hypothetical protein [Vitreimonas sp.]